MKQKVDYWKKLSKEEQEWLRDFENCALSEQTEEEKKESWRTAKRQAQDQKRQICLSNSPEPALLSKSKLHQPPYLGNGEIQPLSRYQPPAATIEDLIIEAIDSQKPKAKKRRNRQKLANKKHTKTPMEGV